MMLSMRVEVDTLEFVFEEREALSPNPITTAIMIQIAHFYLQAVGRERLASYRMAARQTFLASPRHLPQPVTDFRTNFSSTSTTRLWPWDRQAG
jgi:hypothetical protein